jgi:hypothetical protein
VSSFSSSLQLEHIPLGCVWGEARSIKPGCGVGIGSASGFRGAFFPSSSPFTRARTVAVSAGKDL